MTILLIATADQSPCVALVRDTEIVEKVSLTPDRTLGHELLVAVDALLHNHQLSLKNIDRIAVHAGPGHFGGVRQGVTAAAMLAQAHRLPLVAVDGGSFKELVHQAGSGAAISLVEPMYKAANRS